MRGTILCGVSESEEGREALAVAVELSERLDLRLELAHVVEGIGRIDGDGDGAESVSMRGSRERAARVVARLAAEHGVTHSAAQRSAVGDSAALMGQIAAEEAADLIVVSARPHGRFRWGWSRQQACRAAREGNTGAGFDPVTAYAGTAIGRHGPEPPLTSS
jgi:nucleotide-binding universal stress UspA family protein